MSFQKATRLDYRSRLDFGFWNLDCGLKLKKVDARLLGQPLNPKSEI